MQELIHVIPGAFVYPGFARFQIGNAVQSTGTFVYVYFESGGGPGKGVNPGA